MKKYTIPQLISLLGMPALTVIIGLVLLLSPDTASALVGKILAWGAILAAIALGAGAFFGIQAQRNNRILWAVICFAAGVWMLTHPLAIAKILGRVLGGTLMILGARSIVESIRYNGGKLVISRSLVIAMVIPTVGAVLMVLPMAATRLVLNIAGVVVIGIGVAEGIDRIRGRNLLDEGDDPNIIDVEKL